MGRPLGVPFFFLKRFEWRFDNGNAKNYGSQQREHDLRNP